MFMILTLIALEIILIILADKKPNKKYKYLVVLVPLFFFTINIIVEYLNGYSKALEITSALFLFSFLIGLIVAGSIDIGRLILKNIQLKKGYFDLKIMIFIMMMLFLIIYGLYTGYNKIVEKNPNIAKIMMNK